MFDAFAGGYPVPPLPGQVLPPSPRRAAGAAGGRATAAGRPAPTDDRPGHPGGARWLTPASRTAGADAADRTSTARAGRPARSARRGDAAPYDAADRAAHGPRRAARARRRVRRDLLEHVPPDRDRAVPVREGAAQAALPRPPPAQPVRGRPREVHRLRAVRVGVPGGRDLRRGRRQRARRAVLARRAVRPRLPDQLPALHLLRPVHRGVPHARADDDQRVRARGPDARGPHLREAGPAGAAGRGHARRAAPHGRGHHGHRVLPRRGHAARRTSRWPGCASTGRDDPTLPGGAGLDAATSRPDRGRDGRDRRGAPSRAPDEPRSRRARDVAHRRRDARPAARRCCSGCSRRSWCSPRSACCSRARPCTPRCASSS